MRECFFGGRNGPLNPPFRFFKKKHAPINDHTSERDHVTEDIDSHFYATALDEIEKETYDKGIWAKAFAESDGNETKTKAKYIKIRAAQLQAAERAVEEEQKRVAKEEEQRRIEEHRLNEMSRTEEEAEEKRLRPKLKAHGYTLLKEKIIISQKEESYL